MNTNSNKLTNLTLSEFYKIEYEEANEQLVKEKSYDNFINRAYINFMMMKFEDCEADYSYALKIFEQKFFLDKNFFELKSDVHYDIAKFRIKGINNLIEHFIAKHIIKKSEILELRLRIICDLSDSIELATSKNNVLWNLKGKLHDRHLERAKQYFEIKEFKLAIEDLNEVIKIGYRKNNNKYYYQLLINNYINLNETSKVLYYCNKLSKNTRDTSILDFTAKSRVAVTDFEGAIEDYTKAINIDGEFLSGDGESYTYFENRNKGIYLVERGKLKENLQLHNEAYSDYLEAYKFDDLITSKYKELFDNEEFREYIKHNHY